MADGVGGDAELRSAAAAAAPTVAQDAERAAKVDGGVSAAKLRSAVSSVPTQTRERQVGDLFEYGIEKPVTVRRNQSALVPIVLQAVRRPAGAAVPEGAPGRRTRCAASSSRTPPA